MPRVIVLESPAQGVLNMGDILVVHDYDVVRGATTSDVLALLAVGPAALIVVDVGVEGFDGYAFTKEIFLASRPVPVLFVAPTEQDARTRLVGLPWNRIAVLWKPFDMDVFMARVKQATRDGATFDSSYFADELGGARRAIEEAAPAPRTGTATTVASAPPPPPITSRPATPTHPVAKAPAAGGRSILIVEDTFVIRRVLRKYVETAGFAAIEADNGLDALQSVANNVVDLIILDVMLPRLDGFSVLQVLKSDPRYRGIPVIMCTAKNQRDDVLKARKLGAEAFIVKPFTKETLYTKFAELIAGFSTPKA